MKKRDLWTGIIMIALGLACLAASFLNTPLDSLLCGMFGALTAPGIVLVYKYAKYNSPKHAAQYRERLEQEQIYLRDERKEMLRTKSGSRAYLRGLLAGAASMTVFSVLGKLGAINEDTSRLLILFLTGYLLFQLLAGWVLYRLLEKKY